MASPTVIFVTGMHRSGTSVAARAVQALGYNLGKDLMPPGGDNPKGFFEDLQVVKLNDRILKSAGWDWKTAESALYFQEINPTLFEDIKNFYAGMLDWDDHVAVKDPRFCITLPVWLRAMSEVGPASVGLVIAIRNPTEVALSIQQRDHLRNGLEIWHRYTNAVLEQMILFPHFSIMRYEACLKDPERELEALKGMLGVDYIEPKERDEFVKEFVVKGLHRQRSREAVLNAEQTELWQTICKIREHQLVRTSM